MILPSAMWVLWNVPDISGTAALGTLYMCGFFSLPLPRATSTNDKEKKPAGRIFERYGRCGGKFERRMT
jgi:hypothetical protein